MITLKYDCPGYTSNTLNQPPRTIKMSLDTTEADLEELCEFFSDFLKGCGYVFDGQVSIVDTVRGDYGLDDEKLEDYVRDMMASGDLGDTPAETEKPKDVQTEFTFNTEKP